MTEQTEIDWVPDPVGDREKLVAGRDRLKEQLRVVVRERLAERRGAGLAPHEVRMIAETRGWVTGKETGRYWSFLPALLKECGAVPQGFVQSKHPGRKGAYTRIWVHKDFAVDLSGGPRQTQETT